MGTRGRTSAAALSIVTSSVEAVQRPDAPYSLDDEESAVWWATVNALRADWFTGETLPMLANYCRHVVAADRISSLIRKTERGESLDVPEYERLLKMRIRETQAAATLATRLRITQQSSYDRKKAKAAKVIENPWD
jgi:hypothetical protein